MKEIQTVLIAGAGAVGLTAASQLYKKLGKNVFVFADGERLERYRTTGFSVNGEKISFPLVNSAPSISFDLIIIACKNHHLDSVLRGIRAHVGAQTLILSLLNGITSEKTIAAEYGAERVPLGMIIGTDAQHDGCSTIYKQTGTINFGDEKNNVRRTAEGRLDTSGCSERVRLIADLFERCSVPYEVPADMVQRLWYKFMVNVGINQASAVMRLPYGPFQTVPRGLLSTASAGRRTGWTKQCPEANALMRSAMLEVITAARFEHISLNESDIDTWQKQLDTLTPESRTSMCQDIMAGRKTEAELFSAAVTELGKKHGFPTPVNEVLYRQLRALEMCAPGR